jgi:2-dehydropantoate 2-reductase
MAVSVVVWGAGAIGGTIGAYLARAGHDVLFVDLLAEHVARIATDGLRIEGPIDNFTVRAPAVTPDTLKGRHKLMLLAVKAQHTVAATRALAPHLAANGAVVSCQNGLNETVIADIVGPRRTIGAFVNFGADWMEPGRIAFGSRGAVVVGELDGRVTPRISAIHGLLQAFEPDAALSDNIFGFLWGKLAWGTIVMASALTNETMADFTGNAELKPLLVGLVREVCQVAAAEGIRLQGFNGFEPAAFLARDPAAIDASLARIVAFRRTSAKTHSGYWRDIVVRRRPTEVRAQMAPVQAAAGRHGLATPCLDGLVARLAEIEAGTRAVGLEAARDLLSVCVLQDWTTRSR